MNSVASEGSHRPAFLQYRYPNRDSVGIAVVVHSDCARILELEEWVSLHALDSNIDQMYQVDCPNGEVQNEDHLMMFE